jgi:hypothetical protein
MDRQTVLRLNPCRELRVPIKGLRCGGVIFSGGFGTSQIAVLAVNGRFRFKLSLGEIFTGIDCFTIGAVGLRFRRRVR